MLKLLILLATFWTIYAKANLFTGDHQRELKEGELIVHNLAIHEVVAKSENNSYLVKSLDNFNWIFTADRNELSVMSGCAAEYCVNDRLFDVGYLRFVTVEAVTYSGEYLVETTEGWNGFYRPFKNNLARTQGCHPDGMKKVCVGDKVKNSMGDMMEVIALHPDWKIVLKSTDGWNTYQSYVDVNSISRIE